MKKTMVYILALSMLAAALLAGCGETGDNRRDVPPSPDVTGPLPGTDDLTTVEPDMMEPDPRDGDVRDTDGFITDGDVIGGDGGRAGQHTGAGGKANGESGTDGLTVGNSGTGDTENQ